MEHAHLAAPLRLSARSLTHIRPPSALLHAHSPHLITTITARTELHSTTDGRVGKRHTSRQSRGYARVRWLDQGSRNHPKDIAATKSAVEYPVAALSQHGTFVPIAQSNPSALSTPPRCPKTARRCTCSAAASLLRVVMKLPDCDTAGRMIGCTANQPALHRRTVGKTQQQRGMSTLEIGIGSHCLTDMWFVADRF